MTCEAEALLQPTGMREHSRWKDSRASFPAAAGSGCGGVQGGDRGQIAAVGEICPACVLLRPPWPGRRGGRAPEGGGKEPDWGPWRSPERC